jgi:hypothetical protein
MRPPLVSAANDGLRGWFYSKGTLPKGLLQKTEMKPTSM